MNIEEEGEIIRGMKILRTVPLAPKPKPAEVVKAATFVGFPTPPAPPDPNKKPEVPLADQVAKIRREIGSYTSIYQMLSAKLATLRREERGGMRDGIRMPPNGRARGGGNAIDGILVLMRPLVEGTAKPGHSDTLKKEVSRLREEARDKAKKGDVVALGAFDQLDAIHKQL